MKVQIRKSVFETNSSSTHSLQISNNTADDIQKTLFELMCRDTPHTLPKNFEASYIKNNVLELSGFKFVYGGESSDVYLVISNLMAKIQYLYMYMVSMLDSIVCDLDDDEPHKDLLAYRCLPYATYNDPKELAKLNCMIVFGQTAVKALQDAGYNVDTFELRKPVCDVCAYSEGNYEHISAEDILNSETEFAQKIASLLDANKVLYDVDQAYSQYDGVEVYMY